MRGKVLLKIDNENKVTKGGIVLPDNTSANRFRKGTVIAIGSEVKYLTVGDRVAVNRFRADEHMIDGIMHQITEEKDILFAFDGDEIQIDEVNEA